MFLPSLSIYSRSQIERSLLSISTRHAPLLLIGYKCVLGLGQTLRSKAFFKNRLVHVKEPRAWPPLLRLMYIVETLIDPLFTDVAFRRDSEGDGSGHYESGGVMSPPSLVPSARLVSAESRSRRLLNLRNRSWQSAWLQPFCSLVKRAAVLKASVRWPCEGRWKWNALDGSRLEGKGVMFYCSNFKQPLYDRFTWTP